MSLNLGAILDPVISHALTLGVFDAVNAHEPESAPGCGLTAAVWVDRVAPIPAGSGLAATSALIVLNVRGYTSMLAEPADAIDPRLVDAMSALIGAYSGDFQLDGQVRCVDLLGMSGTALLAQAGYLQQDARVYRVMTITLPLIVDNVWEQVP